MYFYSAEHFLAGNPGGPLVCQRCNNCDWYLAGVSSSIRGLEEYTAYTNVIKYEEWITTHTGQEFRQESCVSPSKYSTINCFWNVCAFANPYVYSCALVPVQYCILDKYFDIKILMPNR